MTLCQRRALRVGANETDRSSSTSQAFYLQMSTLSAFLGSARPSWWLYFLKTPQSGEIAFLLSMIIHSLTTRINSVPHTRSVLWSFPTSQASVMGLTRASIFSWPLSTTWYWKHSILASLDCHYHQRPRTSPSFPPPTQSGWLH